jgi:hypothetical protein
MCSPEDEEEVTMKLRRSFQASASEDKMSTSFMARMSMRSRLLGTMMVAWSLTTVSYRAEPSLLKQTRSTFPFFTALRNSL